MPVLDHPVHESVIQKDGVKYGCYNRTGLRRYVMGSYAYGPQRWGHTMSMKCRNYYLWESDPKCEGCTAEKDVDYANTMKGLSDG